MRRQPLSSKSPGQLSVTRRSCCQRINGPDDCLVEVLHSGISTGTERLLMDGRHASFFPGLAIPAGAWATRAWAGSLECGSAGEYAGRRPSGLHSQALAASTDVAGLFGGAAKASRGAQSSRLIVRFLASHGEASVLLALVATAVHAVRSAGMQSASLRISSYRERRVGPASSARVAEATGASGDDVSGSTNPERQDHRRLAR